MGNLVKPQSIASGHFTKYGSSCKSCWYNIQVFSENMGHLEPIKYVILKSVQNYWEFMVENLYFLLENPYLLSLEAISRACSGYPKGGSVLEVLS